MKKNIDYTITLSDKVAQSSCESVAGLIGVTKDAVRQMLANRREIYLKKIRGQWHYMEVKDWKRGNAAPEKERAA